MNPPDHNALRQHGYLVLVAGLSAILPPFGFIGAAAITLMTLRSGPMAGLSGAVIALSVAATLRWLLGDSGTMGIIVAAVSLFPAVLLADLLRTRGSLDLAVQVWFLLGLVTIGVIYALVADPAESWKTLVTSLLDQLRAAGGTLPQADQERLLAVLPYKLMTGSAVANVTLYGLAGLFLGRSWQARLENPGGFRREFQRLMLGYVLFAVTMVTWIAAALNRGEMLLALAMVQGGFWLLQGLAVVHVAVARTQRPGMLLGIFYATLIVALVIGNPIAVLVPLLGISDQIFKYRKRWQRIDSDAA